MRYIIELLLNKRKGDYIMEKKKLKINAAICDARNVTEATLESYESVDINAALILVSKDSKELISRYDVNMNAASIQETPADIEVMIQNGKYEITDGTNLSKPVALVVNGKLDITTASQEVLEKFYLIIVNGLVEYPDNIGDKLPNISVNGKTETYPADAIRLKSKFIMDKTFIIRAEAAKYFARSKVVIEDKSLNIDSLVEKGAKFITKKGVIAEELLEKALPLFDLETDIETIPGGYKYISGETLKDSLVRKHGPKLYVDGDLTISLEGEKALDKLDSLKVAGTVYLLERLKDKFHDMDSEYDDVKTIKGFVLGDKPMVSIDSRLISKHKDGITIQDCAAVNIKEDVSPEEIEENLQFIDCASIFCNQEQRSAVESVAEDVAFIDDSGKSKAGGLKAIFDESGILDKDTKAVNAATYTM